jgi:hypothetical protein
VMQRIVADPEDDERNLVVEARVALRPRGHGHRRSFGTDGCRALREVPHAQ